MLDTLFMGAAGDHNPIHIDLDAARSTGLQYVFVPGMLSRQSRGGSLAR